MSEPTSPPLKRGFEKTLKDLTGQDSQSPPDEDLLFLRAKIEKLWTEIDEERQKQQLRKVYARWAKWVVSIWLSLIVVSLGLVGYFDLQGEQLYSDPVIMTLLATTTLNPSLTF